MRKTKGEIKNLEDFRRSRSEGAQRVDSFGSYGFTFQLNLSGPVSPVTNCTEKDMETSSRRIIGATFIRTQWVKKADLQ